MSFAIATIIEDRAGTLKTEADALIQLFKDHPCDIAARSAQQAAERIRNHAAQLWDESVPEN
jgi:hypothetical protein